MTRLIPQISPPPLIIVCLTWEVPDTCVDALISVLKEKFTLHQRQVSLQVTTWSLVLTEPPGDERTPNDDNDFLARGRREEDASPRPGILQSPSKCAVSALHPYTRGFVDGPAVQLVQCRQDGGAVQHDRRGMRLFFGQGNHRRSQEAYCVAGPATPRMWL